MLLFIAMLVIISIIDISNLMKDKNKKVIVIYVVLNFIVLGFGVYYYINPIAKSFVRILPGI